MNAFITPFVKRTVLAAAAVVGTSASTASAQLVDPSFELPASSVLGYSTVLNNFTGQQGVWGAEAGTNVGPVGAVSPAHLNQMHQMFLTGGVVCQTAQVTDVSWLPANTSGWNASLSAVFTNDSNAPANAGVSLRFFSAANFSSQIGATFASGFTTDAIPQTWEPWSLTVPIPSGTQWIVSEVYFANASLQGGDGYVDLAEMNVIPEPASLGLLLMGGILAAHTWRRTGRLVAWPYQAAG